MTILWTSNEAHHATGGTCTHQWQATGISIDTRTLQPGDLFIALKGDHLDGHDYLEQAREKGACAAIVDHSIKTLLPLLIVDDTLKALRALARANRARTSATIIGLTGSVGKTTTKEALQFLLNKQAPAYATEGNLNNHFGLPLSLARMPQNVRYAIFEMGMNHAGEIAKLTELVRPHIALITAVEAVHLEFFESVAGIAHAKAEIFEGLVPGGTAIIPQDNPYFPILAEKAKSFHTLSFGESEEADMLMTERKLLSQGQQVKASFKGEPLAWLLQGSGKHHALNSLATLTTIAAAKADLDKACSDISLIESAKGRGQNHIITLGDITFTLIDDSYNASPASMRAAFETLANTACKGRRIAVLGDMLELGKSAPEMHAELATALKEHNIDKVYTAGPLMKHLHEALPKTMQASHTKDAEALLAKLTEGLRQGDDVLIKGSNGSKMWKLVDALKAEA